ncbi:MAG: XRE family transcriptional regulator [Saccharofermentanales bacterium]|jgi:transcriptional regulator with XRE-family HTH domain|nr:LexA family transcriptional regulator [Clostridiaceae bacterium]
MLRYNYTESNELGKRLRRVRKAAGMTLQQLSDALNKEYGTHANKGTISKYENGIHEPNASTIFCIAQIIGISVDYLMGKTDLDYPSVLAMIEEKKAARKQAAPDDDGEAAEEQGDSEGPANYSYDVIDNSMSPRYRIGDVLIVRTGMPIVADGAYLVQYKNNQPMVRRIVQEPGRWILKTENRAFDSTEVALPEGAKTPDNVEVFGRVIEYRRSEI